MTIAELFVNLGIKDSGVKKGLDGVKGGLGDVKSMSLEAKAAIIGAVYALERMMSSSAQAGTGFTNFAAMTGQSAEELQRWQYAARQVGVSNEEIESSFKGVQNSMTNMLLGKGAPEGMAMLANKVGFDMSRVSDTFYVMQQIQELAKTVPANIGYQMSKSFGIGDNTFSGMRQNAFRPEVMKKAPIYSNNEIGQLNKVDVAWSNLNNKIKMAFGHLTAKYGAGIVGDISKITGSVMGLVEAFIKLGESMKILQLLGKVAEGWSMILDPSRKDGLAAMGKQLDEKMYQVPVLGTKLKDIFPGIFGDDKDEKKGKSPGKNILPAMKPGDMPASTQNINVNQNLNFQHDGKDHKKTSSSVHKAVKDAYRQMQPQAQGS